MLSIRSPSVSGWQKGVKEGIKDFLEPNVSEVGECDHTDSYHTVHAGFNFPMNQSREREKKTLSFIQSSKLTVENWDHNMITLEVTPTTELVEINLTIWHQAELTTMLKRCHPCCSFYPQSQSFPPHFNYAKQIWTVTESSYIPNTNQVDRSFTVTNTVQSNSYFSITKLKLWGKILTLVNSSVSYPDQENPGEISDIGSHKATQQSWFC